MSAGSTGSSRREVPELEASSDAVPNASALPIWLSTTPEPPARVVAIRLSPAAQLEALETVLGLAAKYDLVLFDSRSSRIHLPLEEMAAHASATFWPAGAFRPRSPAASAG